jgi:hypothetical protein
MLSDLCFDIAYCHIVRMNEHSGSGELQQLVQKEESEEPLSRGGDVTPSSTPTRFNRQSKGEIHSSHELVITYF